eukprot:TRINITY_DN6736_c0_g1_i1.p1 TRINITY_DN6736_c0_g1~~TRINITY_DN6736_c0_g1_i1.p1  ORF type:complete len:120 (-),score=10.26 TRINITY_DN6736_c0_g1_i1:49-408(-)
MEKKHIQPTHSERTARPYPPQGVPYAPPKMYPGFRGAPMMNPNPSINAMYHNCGPLIRPPNRTVMGNQPNMTPAAQSLESLVGEIHKIKKKLSEMCETFLMVTAAVSYTHLTLPTICSV